MPYNFASLDRDEAEEFCADYAAGVGDRLDVFRRALSACGGPAEALDAGRDGLDAVWLWFVDQFGREEPRTPLADAGFEFEVPFWMTPHDWYQGGAEGAFCVTGIAAWLVELVRAELGPLEFTVDHDPRSGTQGHPQLGGIGVMFDSAIAISAGRIMTWESRRQPGELRRLLDELISHRRDSGARAAPTDPGVQSPIAHFDSEDAVGEEVEIEFDQLITWDRRDRFEAILKKSVLLRGITNADDVGTIFATFHGTDDEVASEVRRIWDESA